MADDDHVRRWSSLPDDVDAWVERERAEARGPSRAICLAGDDRALGKVALRLPGRASPATTCDAIVASDHPVGELSYWLVPPARGRGLALAAVLEMLRHGRRRRPTCARSCSTSRTTTPPRCVSPQRLGAERREPARIELDRAGVPQNARRLRAQLAR